MYYMIWETLKY